ARRVLNRGRYIFSLSYSSLPRREARSIGSAQSPVKPNPRRRSAPGWGIVAVKFEVVAWLEKSKIAVPPPPTNLSCTISVIENRALLVNGALAGSTWPRQG